VCVCVCENVYILVTISTFEPIYRVSPHFVRDLLHFKLYRYTF